MPESFLIHREAPPGWYPSVGEYVQGENRADGLTQTGVVTVHEFFPWRPAVDPVSLDCRVLLESGEVVPLCNLKPIRFDPQRPPE